MTREEETRLRNYCLDKLETFTSDALRSLEELRVNEVSTWLPMDDVRQLLLKVMYEVQTAKGQP